jgi:nucleoside-diphosphate-sugar epimerase
MKKAIVLGGGGFIGGHLANKLKDEGFWVKNVDIKKNHEFWDLDDISNAYIQGDLTDPKVVEKVFKDSEGNYIPYDEVYQLAADMGGAGYIFTGENDANVMHNSALINLNVAYYSHLAKVKRVFYSSSACIYPEHNQMDPNNPNCEESSAYPANPDSEYGWEKLFSERLFFSFSRNYNLKVRVARFHNIFGPKGTWTGGKEKAPAAVTRKVAEAKNGDSIEIWGDGQQTRSFLYIDECIKATQLFMRQDEFSGPVNIGSEEMISINNLAKMAIGISGKKIKIDNIDGDDFMKKYGFKCPTGVRGRNSDNTLFYEKMGWKTDKKLIEGITSTYKWILSQL